jgi:hypothetical protein
MTDPEANETMFSVSESPDQIGHSTRQQDMLKHHFRISSICQKNDIL